MYPYDVDDLAHDEMVMRLRNEIHNLPDAQINALERTAAVWFEDVWTFAMLLDKLSERDRRAVLYLLGMTVQVTVNRLRMAVTTMLDKPRRETLP